MKYRMRVVEEAQTFLGILRVFLKIPLFFFFFKGETETGKALKLHFKKNFHVLWKRV